jgi:hypothetical protein
LELITTKHIFLPDDFLMDRNIIFIPASLLVPPLWVVTVLGYRSGGPGSIPNTTRKKVVDMERVPLSLVSTTEELLERKVVAPV